jgi:hypothetical protein
LENDFHDLGKIAVVPKFATPASRLQLKIACAHKLHAVSDH